MSTNLTDEIRSIEAAAAKTVADAKAQALDLVAKSRDAAAARVKEARQSQFRDYRTRLGIKETEAAQNAAKTVAEGKAAASQFVEAHAAAVEKTAQWLAEEVVSRYGRC